MAADLTDFPEFASKRIQMASPVVHKTMPKVMLQITCPRCRGAFIVGPKRWCAEKSTTRSCPYCFKVSLKENPNG